MGCHDLLIEAAAAICSLKNAASDIAIFFIIKLNLVLSLHESVKNSKNICTCNAMQFFFSYVQFFGKELLTFMGISKHIDIISVDN